MNTEYIQIIIFGSQHLRCVNLNTKNQTLSFCSNNQQILGDKNHTYCFPSIVYLGISCWVIVKDHTLISSSTWVEVNLEMGLPRRGISTDCKSTTIRLCVLSQIFLDWLIILPSCLAICYVVGCVLHQKWRRTSLGKECWVCRPKGEWGN